MFLGRLLVLLLSLTLCLTVILLPVSTAVPAWIWLPLTVADAALLVLSFGLKPVRKGLGVSLGGIFLAAVMAVLTSQAFAMTPPITGADGKPLPGSIASLEQVTLNDSRQWISNRGEDVTKPVLLFLAGGPGGSQLSTERFALGELEKHFVVVIWEQPGAGKSF